ncbi:hypothetical protein BDZ89DRAFT_1078234 [Hymenopellis radicata]|nr:hypothetical protein BDZ89DRAFT_1078234 [Hymenopellis radicata]
MPPRPQPRPRKAPAPSKDLGNLTQADKDAKAMPPPPVPKRILEPEMAALSTHLKNAMVKTGLIYGFSADTRRLGIQKHAPKPPLSLTSALGSEVEKYDQLCDAMESHLLRAIAILERDLKREEQRVKEAEEAAKASAMQVDPEPTIPPPTSESAGTVSVIPSSSSPTSAIPGRRPSAISISSLHRPAFPLKLDLSAPGLRISPDEVTSFSIPDGLHSPVTLAPKSARPTDYPHDLIDMASLTAVQPEASSSGRVDIDLTLPDAPAEGSANMNIDATMGTADKPIELDLESMDIDMSDLFGDTVENTANDADATGGDDLFSPVIAHPDLAGKDGEGKEDQDFLNSLRDDAGNEDLFSLEAQPKAQVAGPANQTAPSPGTLLASFTAGNAEGNGNQFNMENIDYNFFGNGEDPNVVMDQFLGDINTSGGAAAGPSTKAE